MRARRHAGRRRAVLTAMLVVALLYGTDDGSLRTHTASLAGEWWACLVHQEPPTAYEETIDAYREDVARKSRLAGRSPRGQGTLPATVPRTALEGIRGRAATGQAQLSEVTVAIIDSGIDGWHPDLRTSEVLPGVDLLNPCGDGRTDSSGHGTAVAGVVASSSRGAAAGVRLLPVRTSLDTGAGLRPVTAAGIVWATRHGADVINLSRASQSSLPRLFERAAVRYAVDRGVVIVASAGNDPDKPVAYPAAYPEVIAVTSVDSLGRLSGFAARGRQVDLAAPGSRVRTLAVNGGYRIGSGTSMAAPLVTAAVARLEAVNPDLTPAQVQALLRRTSSPVLSAQSREPGSPFGILDVEAALRAAATIGKPVEAADTDRT